MGDALAEAILRLLGAFYALGSLAVLRQAATAALLDAALAAMAASDAAEARAGRQRAGWMMAIALAVGLGGIALGLLLAAALPLFLAAAALQAAYLGLVAPRRLDPADPPDAEGRAGSRRAFWLHLAATGLVGAAWWQGVLLAPEEAPWTAAAALGLAAGFAAYALRLWRAARPLPGVPGWAPEPRRRGLLLMPGWEGVPLHDAATGRALDLAESDAILTREEWDAAEAWIALFRELADPDDPWRVALRNPADAARLEAAGRPILEQLRARLGADAVAFSPLPRPVHPLVEARRVRLSAAAGFLQLLCLDDDPPWAIDPDLFGLSPALAAALADGAEAPDPARRAALVARLRRELVATGRAAVVVEPEEGSAPP